MVLLEAHQIMSKKQRESKEDQRQFWQMAIETWQASGMSVSRFCEVEGLQKAPFTFGEKSLPKRMMAKQTNKKS